MNASNAKLNYDKTQVLSLSGSPHPVWQAFLQEQGITHWHDRDAPLPLTYLGYAMISSPQQRTAHAQKMIAELRRMCQIFGNRSLTYRSKVTIVNTLIYSKLWHMIRLFSFNQHEMQQIQQLAASFINNNATITRFSFATLTLPRKQGGLQLLNPQQQAHALQWRWLYYLLHPSQPVPTHMPAIPILRHTLNYILATPHVPSYHWSLLFPSCRPIIPRVFGPIGNLLKAVDTIDNDLQYCSVDIPTCLQLPLFALFQATLPTTHPHHTTFISPTTVLQPHRSARHLRGSDIFFYNATTFRFELHQPAHQGTNSRIRSAIIQLIQSHQLHFHNFVSYNFIPWVPRSHPSLSQLQPSNNIEPLSTLLRSKISTSFNTESFSYIVSSPTTSGFKSLPHVHTPTTNPPILSPTKWQQFWRLRIPLNARNTWYRILHRKITTRQLLNTRLPSLFTPYCELCRPTRYRRHGHSPTETNQHFLFSCPKKIQVWTTAVVHYIDPSFAHFSFLHYSAIIKLQPTITRTPSVPFQRLSLYQVFACILQAIWTAHYQAVFADIPFAPLSVIAKLHKSLAKLDHEESLNTLT